MSIRIAFDLDETLGVPIIDGTQKVSWQLRPGASELLDRLSEKHTLCLWSVSTRRYVDKALTTGLHRWFSETYSYDEVSVSWKDVRRLRIDLLVDDSPHHREAACGHGIDWRYVVVSANGSPEDDRDPQGWVRLVLSAIERLEHMGEQ